MNALVTSSLAEAVPPRPMKAILVAAMASGLGAERSGFVHRRLGWAQSGVAEHLADVAPAQQVAHQSGGR